MEKVERKNVFVFLFRDDGMGAASAEGVGTVLKSKSFAVFAI